jgi:fido (protein-threonine AMPylation protein)
MWEYTQRGNHHRILSAEAARLMDELRGGKIDIISVLKDSRPIHKRFFSQLAPRDMKYLAGGYRGTNKGALKNYRVKIRGNPLVGSLPERVLPEIDRFGIAAEKALIRLDGIHQDKAISADERIAISVEIACRLVAEFLLIHPYVNGNGHVARFMLIGILARYGHWLKSFDLHPAPFVPSYGDSIGAYQRSLRGVAGGDRDLFHRYVFNCFT